MVNNLIIDTLEGQLITILVVTAFILVFLIREWVVQQQPNLNGGAELDAMVAAGQNAVAPAQVQRVEQRPGEPERGGDAEALEGGAELHGPRARIIARARPRRPRPEGHRRASVQGDPGEEATESSETEGTDLGDSDSLLSPATRADPPDQSIDDGDLAAPQRPAMPSRDMLARAAEIRRTHEEQSKLTADGDSHEQVFKELWIRADKKPTEVLKIIEQEGRRDELAWIVALMEKVEGMNSASAHHDHRPSQVGPASSSAAYRGNEDADDSQGHLEADEGFVLLDKPSLTPSPEAELDYSASKDDATHERTLPKPQELFDITNQVAMDSQDPNSTQAAADTQEQWDTSHPESTPIDKHEREPLNDYELTTQPAESKSGRNSTLATPSESNGNPFHPDFDEELPESSPLADMITIGDGVVEASGPVETQASSAESNGSEIQEHLAPERHVQAHTLFERVMNWLWGGVTLPPPVEQAPGDDEHVVNDIANEAPFVPVEHAHPLRPVPNPGPNAVQDPEVIAAAIQAGIDPNEVEAVEDIEDLEGILELVGMQGPIAGLIQNGMFCAVLVSLTIFFGIWIPYIAGKIFLVLLTHPVSLILKVPLRWAASTADMVIDFFIFTVACAFYWTDSVISFLCVPVGWLIPPLGRISQNTLLSETAKGHAESALGRIAKASVALGSVLAKSDIPTFSIVAHESLRWIETTVTCVLHVVGDLCMTVFTSVHDSASIVELASILVTSLGGYAETFATLMTENARSLKLSAPLFLEMSPLHINLSVPQRTSPLDYDLASWDTKDRALAVVFGYLLFGLLGVVYLHLSSWVRGANKAGRVEGAVADALYQAGGVMKVVLIISIEMIAFPLYCGLLLDVALLPLFGNVTIISRISFTVSSPYTSIFVHWFVGTCYMFHFALFVSMCRKILRNGVLFFIRDPDDPTFHPIRDVLERSVSTQLWKISFSALVYGGLVIVCLGGVVWGIAYSFDGVLPIHWSSNEPVLEFPVDLLFYNFLMPLAVKFFKPSEGLNKIYTWWFRNCARSLRLTNFFFSEEKNDEEGRHVRHKWIDVFNMKPRHNETMVGPEAWQQNGEIPSEVEEGDVYFLTDGKYVRAPASDQVRIPKGAHTFVEVDKDNKRVDGEPDPEQGLHGHKNDMFTKVYIPPFFRVRIGIFVFLIWLFAATTGVSVTIVPLVLGRLIFARLAPSEIRMNDIYAFSIGITSFSEITSRPERHIIHLIQDWTLGVLYLKMAARVILYNTPSRPAAALRGICQ
ncbi:E3 ubiquitin-protein ligase MARCH6, partial [Lecanoromycetidae sp. Uapishka_2]